MLNRHTCLDVLLETVQPRETGLAFHPEAIVREVYCYSALRQFPLRRGDQQLIIFPVCLIRLCSASNLLSDAS